MSAVPRSRNRLARRLGWFAVASLVAVSIVPSTVAAPGEKRTICHSTGSDSNPFVAIDVGLDAADLAPHLDSEGNPTGGDHAFDFLLPRAGFDDKCNAIVPTVAPTTAPPTTAPPTTAPPTTAPPTTAPPTVAPTTAPPTVAPTTAPPTVAPTGGVLPTEAVPTATPAGTVAGVTATPGTTLPPTDTLGESTTAGSDGWRIVLLALAATLAAALLLTPARVIRKDR